LLLLPVGWYRVEYQAEVENSDDLEQVRELVMVFDDEEDCYEDFLVFLGTSALDGFARENLRLGEVESQVKKWVDQFFPCPDLHFGTDLLQDLFRIARHTAQNAIVPRLFKFEDRNAHDLDKLAKELGSMPLRDKEKNEALVNEYARSDRMWSSLYYRYDLFKSQYDACVNRLLHIERHGRDPESHEPTLLDLPSEEKIFEREPSDEVKQQVKRRDHYRCLCCGYDTKKGLQVDHVNPHYYGGGNPEDNLQTLCSVCNRLKKTQNINFRNRKTTLTEPQISWRVEKYPEGKDADDLGLWTRCVARNVNFFYRCAAVDFVEIGKRGDRFYNWRIGLNAGNNPVWVTNIVKVILLHARRERERIKRGVPETIIISSPGNDDITVSR
jgi:5-methylcytosine-specific restriction endonuclease McrA